MTFEINVNTEKYNKTMSGNLLTSIYVKANDFYFPDKDWTDFTSVILDWWVNQSINLLSQKKRKVEFDFMDGSYKIIVTRKNSKKLMLKFVRGYDENGEQILFKSGVDKNLFISELVKAYNTIIESNLLSERYQKVIDLMKEDNLRLLSFKD